VGAEPDEVAGKAAQLGENDAQVLAPARDLALEQLLDGEGVHEVVALRVQVVHAVGHDHALLVGLVLALLLHAGVEIADHALALDDGLAL
jgi:hypothetical protein